MDIAIIDSGIGGTSLLPYFFKYLPTKKFLYYADTKNLPYGLKSTQQLFDITVKNVKKIIDKYKPKIIVFGCNTIGVSIFEMIKKTFPKQVFFSIKPNINNIFLKDKKTLVLATSKTINELKKENSYLNNTNIVLCKMPLLANKIENNLHNTNNIVPYLKRRLSNQKHINCIVLGCTHYYFVKNQIQSLFKQAQIIDGVEILTQQILFYLQNEKTFKTKLTKINSSINVKLVLSKRIKSKKIYKMVIHSMIKNNKI